MHATPWCRHVFACSCVHMFTSSIVFTLGGSPVSVALGFSALATVLFYLLCESCVFKVYVSQCQSGRQFIPVTVA